ncbi:lysophospholipase catalytic domain-containing protein [Colletotrichum graminicola]|uniref:Lysophospholipase n=1 Tax=Colletotrichum graminicola (strain M1.001 / M2 / FGSC 10212) TaxID=645133 RepID=E3R146_COLGM|nr:lysophospholipase catalytic domain-containing protein [Colletotrichum graminicola M1.001]EFQ36834.1 lysophospholipase catalytic domain-containing protein [Colletotrichum graminicola M1.001]WDK20934.1 lysophospholipase catalytic domain-containing protein [Colletotrichum graminicola]
MLLLPLLATAATVAPVWAAGPVTPMAAGMNALDPRTLPNSPSGGYAPAIVDCPAVSPTIRSALALSPNETAWLTNRRSAIVEPLRGFLTRANIPDFDAGAYIDGLSSSPSQLPNVAIAISGGGYRALMNGAGFLAAADSRTPSSTSAGGIGGLLQSATYLSGLSGGGWLIGSLFFNNFSSVVDLQQSSAVWRFDNSIFTGPKKHGLSIFNTATYWKNIISQVDSKEKGFIVSVTDYWGRALSNQLINDLDGGPAYTFSSIAESPDFQAGAQPFPILVADGRAPGEHIISLNATVYEFNPFELGTWDNTAFGFAPLPYLASNFTNGSITAGGSCVRGFDQAGFVIGTSSSLFNQFLLRNLSTSESERIPEFVQGALRKILKVIDEDDKDIAPYVPNPFFGWNPSTNPTANSSQLTLVDGGEDHQNIPLQPLIQPNRAVDVVFAVDSTSDTTFHWPNGSALRHTYNRAAEPIANGTLFPPVPDANTFINLGLNRRPTFFGCNASNFTLSSDQHLPPLIVYIPNAPYVAHSNVSTFDLKYNLDQRDAIIQNGYNAATQGNATLDEEWPVCVACAVLSRSMERARQTTPTACASCFQRYCWNGTLDTRDPPEYEPNFAIGA